MPAIDIPLPEELSMTSTPLQNTQSLATVHDLLARLDPQSIEPCGVPGCIHLAPGVVGAGAEQLMAA